MADLIDLVIYTKDERPDLKLGRFTASSSDLCTLRHHLLLQALDWAADAILWADDDHTFAQNALLRMIAHDVPVVGCNYRRRVPPHLPTAAKDGRLIETSADRPPLERVDQIGLGLALVKTEPILRLREKGGFFPMFFHAPRDNGTAEGEDVFFFRKLGVPVYVDHALSMETGHIGEAVYGFSSAAGAA